MTDTSVGFDLGPLSWVQAEIDQALARGIDALAAFAAMPEDLAALKHARNHVHQAAGAIRMVGLDAVVAYTDEIERQLTRLEELAAPEVPGACLVADRACRKLRIFLAEVVNGTPPTALILFPEYEAMQRERGVMTAVATDLFYPDLGVRAPDRGPATPIPAGAMPSHLVKQRRTYQHGLLAFLRGDREGARAMGAAAAGIERATAQPSLRVFWWTVGALFDALAEGGLEVGFGVKQLAGRIDLQIRRVASGSAKVADRLRREVLYFIAISAPVAPSVLAAQQAFRLGGLIPSAEVLNADLVRLQPLLREAREQLASAKDTWLKVTSGRAENLPRLKEMMTSVHACAMDIGNAALTRLAASLAARLDGIPPSGNVPEMLAMEYATGMLLAENAVENFAGLSKEFPKQVDAMLARLDAAQAARPVPANAAPLLDEMSRRAQERLLLAQVGREIQANLRHMEQVLDTFFRDHAKRADLATLARDSQQIRGALKMLGLDDAEHLLGLCQQQIETYSDPETPVDDVSLELLAESLSGLGFYVEAVEQQRPQSERLIAPLLAKRLGEAPLVEASAGETVEAAVEELRSALPALVAEMHRAPMDAGARELLKARLGDLLDDAKLIDDGELIAQAEDALRELETGGAAALEAAVTAIAGGAGAPAPAISDETQRLLSREATGLDAELLDIYLAEAAEVLDTIAAQHRVLQENFGDRDALVTVRRQFHTLKGSGRMVGLTELGELAYDVEKIHNRLLEEDRPVTPTVLGLIGVAERDFRHWVAGLKAAGHVTADPAQLHAAIREVESELPGDRDSVLEPATKAPAGQTTPTMETAPAVHPEVPAELPELGSAPTALAPLVDTPDTGDVDGLEVIDVGHFGEVPTREAAEPEIAAHEIATAETAPARPYTDEIVIGEVTVSTVLYNILVDEADQHLATLAHEMSLLQSDPHHEPSAAMVRASHTLCGIHRTGGFPLIASTAKSLEQCLLGLTQIAPAMREPALPVLARAVRCVAQLVGCIRARTGFTAEDMAEAAEVSRDLEALRQQAGAAPVFVDAEMQAERDAARDDRAEVPVPAVELEREASAVPFAAIDVGASMPALVTDGAQEAVFESPPAVAVGALESGTAEAQAEAVAQGAEYTVAQTHVDADAGADADSQEPVQTPVQDIPEAQQFAVTALPPESEAIAHQPDDDQVPVSMGSDTVPATAEFLAHGASEATEAGTPATSNRAAGTPVAFVEVRDDIDDQVLPIFLEEAAELFPQAGEQLRAWRRVPGDTASAIQLRRTLHTFKGSARMAGAMRLGELTHLMESRFVAGDTLVTGNAELFEALDTDLDHIAYVLDALREGRANVPLPWLVAPAAQAGPATEMQSLVAVDPSARSQAWLQDELPVVATPSPPHQGPIGAVPSMAAKPSLSDVPAADSVAPKTARPVVVPLMTPGATATPEPAERDRIDVESGTRAMLRVRADVIDRLANEAGEVAIARARVEGELRSLKANLLELTGSVIRLRTQVREIEIQAESQIQSRMSQVGEGAEGFDPLEFDRYTRFQELARSLAEGVNDVSTVQQALLRNLDDADTALNVQARLSRDMQQQLFSVRTVPFGSVAERLYRILRATAKELDKRANLDIRGGQTELDRSVLEKLIGPLEHLLRNAVDHGIERREARAAAGKSRTGEITLTVRQVANEIVIELTDDGAGLNLDEIRAKGVALGKFAADARPTDAQLVECIFEPGFSTASRVTQVSGRGIGMDVVRAEIGALGGRIEVSTNPGRGTTFMLYLPLTLAVAQAVLVRVAGRLWALPAPMVEQVLQVSAEALAGLYAARRVEWQGGSYPLHYLPRLLGDTRSDPELARHNPVLLLRAGNNLAAVHVDEMVGNQEVVIKNIGPQLARVSGIAGATVLGTGEIVLIVNAVQLALRADVPGFDESAVRVAPESGARGAQSGRTRPLVMIVDDSLTVRKITSRLLLREGFRVTTAKDGVDALELLESESPDVILLDIEMPRMDGFEFTKTIKREPRTAGIPIVMITSRIAEKHRSRAKELGVDLYLGKPYQEAELLQHLQELLALTA